MAYDFDTQVSRRGTASAKWDLPREEGVLPLWVADMDFLAAPAILEAMHRRVEGGVFGYVLPPASWHDSLVTWLSLRHGWQVQPHAMLDSTGVIPALAAVVRAFCDTGDKVIVQTPIYNAFFTTIRNQGCEVLESPLRRVSAKAGGDGDFTYEMDFEDLERKAADPRAKLFLLCNPHNPVGRAWTADELCRVGDICLQHGLFVASDEIHADLQMPGSRHVPFASVAESFRRCSLTFWSASKAFNLAGLQTAVVICADSKVRERVRHYLDVHGTGWLNPFGFLASSVAWDGCADWLDELCAYLRGNYRTFLDFVHSRLPQFQTATLEATYLAWLDVTAAGIPSLEMAQRLECEAKVKFAPGAMYGEPRGASFLRINLACPRTTLADALERLASWFLGMLGEDNRSK